MSNWTDVTSDYFKKVEQFKQNMFNGGTPQAPNKKLTDAEQNLLTAGLRGRSVNTAASGN